MHKSHGEDAGADVLFVLTLAKKLWTLFSNTALPCWAHLEKQIRMLWFRLEKKNERKEGKQKTDLVDCHWSDIGRSLDALYSNSTNFSHKRHDSFSIIPASQYYNVCQLSWDFGGVIHVDNRLHAPLFWLHFRCFICREKQVLNPLSNKETFV